MIRLHVQEDLKPGVRLSLEAAPHHYLFTVMRLRAGAEIVLFNGRDGEWTARLETVGKRSGALSVEVLLRPQGAPSSLELAVALIKRQRLDAVVEKAVELGVGRIRLVVTQRTNADHVNLDRLAAIATEAAEQSGRLDVPAISPPAALEEVLHGLGPLARILFCDEAGDDPDLLWGGAQGRAAPIAEALAGVPRIGGSPFAVLIGPEGGFTPEERAGLRGLQNVIPASLGPRILRADTAAVSALALVQATVGDWRTRSAAKAGTHEIS